MTSGMQGEVCVIAGGTWHAPQLAYELSVGGLLGEVITSTPRRWFLRRVSLPADSVRVIWGVRLLGTRVAGRYWSGTAQKHAEGFGRAAARQVTRQSPRIVVVFARFGLEVVTAASAVNSVSVIERGSTHVLHQRQVIREEQEAIGQAPSSADGWALDRELAEYDRATFIMVPSTFARQTFIQHGVPGERVLQVPYGVDLIRFAPGERAGRVGGGPLRVITVGGLGLRKGTHYLLRAIGAVSCPVELVCVGTIESAVRAQLRALEGVAHVTVLPPVGSHDLAQLYREADVFCLPSVEEGMSLAVLEAMASGLPVVVTPETGYGDLIKPGQEGLVVPSRDANAIAAALGELAGDDDRRLRMGGAARRFAESYSWSRYGQEIRSLYASLLAKGDARERRRDSAGKTRDSSQIEPEEPPGGLH